ncbi:MAG: hypothetical protein A2133_07260 [Actinobacteria bacterium RBG_16_64_13]|nr:MAG: hypothetical protein A2133_07260 [Actinobacteria bacterium RBG_16_64_13]
MATRKRTTLAKKTKSADYRHTGSTRKNIPPAQIAAEGKLPRAPRVRYQYDPHLPPVLRFDPTGNADRFPDLVATAGHRPLTEGEQTLLSNALRTQQPWLEWSGKREQHQRGGVGVDPVALHIHERVSAQACIRAATREDVQRDLFADPEQPYQQAVQFYKHDVDWANRLILGDSLQVMASLSRREDLAGKVQMIYLDPPYGIKFSSNFQPTVKQKAVKDRDNDVTREPEMVRAYRDTWTLGIHSYLAYLRDRLIIARELLADTGSIFVQISDANLHRVRALLDELFGTAQYCGLIAYSATTGQTSARLAQITDYLVWYAKDRAQVTYRDLYEELPAIDDPHERYVCVETDAGEIIDLSVAQKLGKAPYPPGRILKLDNLTSQTGSESSRQPFVAFGHSFVPGGSRGWSSSVEDGLPRLLRAGFLHRQGDTLWWKSYRDRGRLQARTALWLDTRTNAFSDPKVYVVQTSPRAIERCLLMTTAPGDLVLDPTCGSGTTAFVAEQWGRRWITTDTSRVALSLARQRILTARYPYYELRPVAVEESRANPGTDWLTDPSGDHQGKCTFKCKTVPRVGLKSVAKNTALDPIIASHESILATALGALNAALRPVPRELRATLTSKLAAKEAKEGKKSLTEADVRRWQLPAAEWREWEVPFDSDPAWPKPLQAALLAYRTAWRAMSDEIANCVSENAEMVELADQPNVLKNVVRVSGPFTVEGVRPEELSLSDGGVFDPTPNESEEGPSSSGPDNLAAYLTQMVQHLRRDGLTFIGNRRKHFARLEPLTEHGAASLIHAEGAWEEGDNTGNPVAVGFGPQYGPVTAEQVEELIRASKRYDELVVAGFSFDAEATAAIQQAQHPKLRIHEAHVRPDINPGMAGLLKDTPNSELFTVFGQPEVKVVRRGNGDWTVALKGVDIYDPIENTVRSTGAEKVAAWFLDSDFDGRCFCVSQAFFPDQNAWEKISKALGSAADADAFEAFKGTESLPFPAGKHNRIAVKVVDPRGNEVMAIRKLEA